VQEDFGNSQFIGNLKFIMQDKFLSDHFIQNHAYHPICTEGLKYIRLPLYRGLHTF